MQKLKSKESSDTDDEIRTFLLEYLGPFCSKEFEWLCDSLAKGIRAYMEVEGRSRYFRLPAVLTESNYVSDLHRGHALRSLRRIHLLCQVENVIEGCLDDIIGGKFELHSNDIFQTSRDVRANHNFYCILMIIELGHEQLAQRGCQTGNVSSLDPDLKARLVTTEEITLAISLLFRKLEHKAPAAWWDRTCDIGLIVGVFIHGLGNYDSMLNDEKLPFACKIREYAKSNGLCTDAHKRFVRATTAAKQSCDDALEASKLRAQKEVQKAVAAAAAASSKREKDAAMMREGGTAAEVVYNNSNNEHKIDNLYEIREGEDDHFITLPRVRADVISGLRAMPTTFAENFDTEVVFISSDTNVSDEMKGKRRSSSRHPLSMPDARILTFRLKLILAEIDGNLSNDVHELESENVLLSPKMWPASKEARTNQEIRDSVLPKALTSSCRDFSHQTIEYAGIGINASQCAVSHRTIDDRADYSIGAASIDLLQVAYGPESPRYLRGLGVPMTFGRLGLVALINADVECLNSMLYNEHRRFYGDDTSKSKAGTGKEETGQKPPISTDLGKKISNETNDEQAPMNVDVGDDSTNDPSKEAIQAKDASKMDVIKDGLYEDPFVSKVFQENIRLRAGICMILFQYGYPLMQSGKSKLSEELWAELQNDNRRKSDRPAPDLFQAEGFKNLLEGVCCTSELPPMVEIQNYIEKSFLPHCLKLCLYGNGPRTRDARGSKGEYETSYGTSRYPEPSENLQSPLPDPCLPLEDQSIEAVGMANAILRRVRLMKCILHVAGGNVPESIKGLLSACKSPTMCQSMDGLPVWWCPWQHDLALFVHASTHGLFSIMKDREESSPILSRDAVVDHIRSTFISGKTMIPRDIYEKSSEGDVEAWIRKYAEDFPSMNVIERRLAFLCALVTEKLDGDFIYHNLPMFDHGAWPRN